MGWKKEPGGGDGGWRDNDLNAAEGDPPRPSTDEGRSPMAAACMRFRSRCSGPAGVTFVRDLSARV